MMIGTYGKIKAAGFFPPTITKEVHLKDICSPLVANSIKATVTPPQTFNKSFNITSF